MVPVTPQVVKGSQAWASAEEAAMLACSVEHFGDHGPPPKGGPPLVVRVFPGFLSLHQIYVCI